MLQVLILLSFVLLNNLMAINNVITLTATIPSNANVQMKTTQVNSDKIIKDIYLENNNQGLTISLSKSTSQHTLVNYVPLGTMPMNLSNKIHEKPTRVGELIISKTKNASSMGIIIAVK